jgi:hypothetical protein
MMNYWKPYENIIFLFLFIFIVTSSAQQGGALIYNQLKFWYFTLGKALRPPFSILRVVGTRAEARKLGLD